MNSKYAATATVIALIFSQISAKAGEGPHNDQSNTTSVFGNLSLKVGEPFLAARARILRAGWHPVRMHRDYEYIGTEKELIDRKFVEVAYCSIDAGSLCVLYYRKKTKCLRLGTIGERLSYMKVTRWSEECPENQ